MIRKTMLKTLVMLILCAVIAACGGMPPVSIPSGAPIALSINVKQINFSSRDPWGSANYGQIGNFLITEATKAQVGTKGLTAEALDQQKELSSLFERELRMRLEKLGAKVLDSMSPTSIIVSVDHLEVGYHRLGYGAFEPVASVWVHATSDPARVGAASGQAVRTVATRVEDPAYSIRTLKGFLDDREKGYSGLRRAIVDLSERVATSLSKAQRGNVER